MLINDLFSISVLAASNLLSMNLAVPAYIDPNTGGMLFQILAVLFGVISGALLIFSGKIKGFYYQLRRRMNNFVGEKSDEITHQEFDQS